MKLMKTEVNRWKSLKYEHYTNNHAYGKIKLNEIRWKLIQVNWKLKTIESMKTFESQRKSMEITKIGLHIAVYWYVIDFQNNAGMPMSVISVFQKTDRYPEMKGWSTITTTTTTFLVPRGYQPPHTQRMQKETSYINGARYIKARKYIKWKPV